jgi:hypothetical protein
MASEGVLATLRQGWRALDRVDAPRAVIGGLALTAWKHARYTRDADVLVAVDQQRVGDVVRALAAAGFRPRHDPPLRVIDGQGIVQITFQPGDALMPFQFDVLLATGEFQRETIARAVPWPLPGGGDDVRVVRPDDLLVIKLLSGRIIDRADAAMVLRENQPDIDFQRLHRAISDHGLAGTYREIWAEAFPDEPPPEIDSRPPSGAGR